jgi:hydrogenase expression/formation protein HypC
MCLAVPGKIVKIEKDIATIDYGKEKRTAKIIGLKAKKGEYVIVQAGIVMQKIPKKEAIESLKAWQKLS